MRVSLPLRILIALIAGLLGATACSNPGHETPAQTLSAAEQAAARRANRPTLSVVSPPDRAMVTSPFVVSIEAQNLMLAPKGAVRDGEAHLHVITTDCVPAGEVIPDDDIHLHYGDGSAELLIELPPGDYELCVQAGDGFHVALGITTELAITVVP